jgi:hypothetical protein
MFFALFAVKVFHGPSKQKILTAKIAKRSRKEREAFE